MECIDCGSDFEVSDEVARLAKEPGKGRCPWCCLKIVEAQIEKAGSDSLLGALFTGIAHEQRRRIREAS